MSYDVWKELWLYEAMVWALRAPGQELYDLQKDPGVIGGADAFDEYPFYGG
jgi:hypothetical protein